jgi:hypothetical protein
LTLSQDRIWGRGIPPLRFFVRIIKNITNKKTKRFLMSFAPPPSPLIFVCEIHPPPRPRKKSRIRPCTQWYLYCFLTKELFGFTFLDNTQPIKVEENWFFKKVREKGFYLGWFIYLPIILSDDLPPSCITLPAEDRESRGATQTIGQHVKKYFFFIQIKANTANH